MPPSDRTIGKLVLSVGGRVLRELLIDRNRVTIGRRPYNDLLLDDLTVSGEHAIVHTGPKGESVIHDLQSRNGTLVNGMPVMQQVLADGDVIDVGIYRIVYQTERLGFNVNDFVPQELPRAPQIRPAAPPTLPSLGSAGINGESSPAGGVGARPPVDPLNRRGQAGASWTTFLGAGRTGADSSPPESWPGVSPDTNPPATSPAAASPPSPPSPPGRSNGPSSVTSIDGGLRNPGNDGGSGSSQGPETRPGAGAGTPPGASTPPGAGKGGAANDAFPPIIEPTSTLDGPSLPSRPLPSLPPTGAHKEAIGQPGTPGASGAPGGVRRFVPPLVPRVDPARFGRVLIRYLGGHDAGREVVMDRPIVSIRNGSGQVAVVARRHGGYFLTHLEGLAYPLVNGESIGLGAHALRDNDLIELAGTILQFCIDGPAS